MEQLVSQQQEQDCQDHTHARWGEGPSDEPSGDPIEQQEEKTTEARERNVSAETVELDESIVEGQGDRIRLDGVVGVVEYGPGQFRHFVFLDVFGRCIRVF